MEDGRRGGHSWDLQKALDTSEERKTERVKEDKDYVWCCRKQKGCEYCEGKFDWRIHVDMHSTAMATLFHNDIGASLLGVSGATSFKLWEQRVRALCLLSPGPHCPLTGPTVPSHCAE